MAPVMLLLKYMEHFEEFTPGRDSKGCLSMLDNPEISFELKWMYSSLPVEIERRKFPYRLNVAPFVQFPCGYLKLHLIRKRNLMIL